MSPDFLRRRALADWRGLAEPVPRPDKCASVGDLLKRILPKLGLADRLCEEQVTGAWREIVGDFLAQHSVPAGLAGGVLTVQVIQPSVRYELERTWKREILDKLRARFGNKVVREIRFRL